MTTTQKDLLTGALVGAAIGAAGAFAYSLMGGSYEDGIRVKNGSLVLTTLSGNGFERHGNGYRTRRKTHGCYTVVAVGGTCLDGRRDLDNAKSVSFSGNDTQGHEADDEVGGSRFKLKNGANWSLEEGGTVLRYTAATYLASFSAAVGATRLSCTGTDDTPLSVWLTSTDCR